MTTVTNKFFQLSLTSKVFKTINVWPQDSYYFM